MLNQEQQTYSKILDQLLEDGLTTSYKIFWFSGIFKEIQLKNQSISFKRIVSRMLSASWDLIIEHDLNLGAVDMLHDLVFFINAKYDIPSNIDEEELVLFLDNLKDEKIEKEIAHFYKMVPYRLLTPFFSEDLKGLIDAKKNYRIELLSQSKENILYAIDSEKQEIKLDNGWYNYIYNNRNIIDGWLNFKVITFLQKRNPNTTLSIDSLFSCSI